ncbi:MAG: dihydrofolate reductase [Bacteroidales bacterium]|nr:dihydrofolate reductase [Bacteroidales bacterium]
MNTQIIIIAAIDRAGAIGYKNQLLFHLSADLKRFKELTIGHTVIMGRHTFESLPKGALPNRRNIVLSSNSELLLPNVEIFSSLELAIAHSSDDEKIFIIGGAEVYKQAIERADQLYLTEIDAIAPNADVYFPIIDPKIWHEKRRESHPMDEKHVFAYSFVDYERI